MSIDKQSDSKLLTREEMYVGQKVRLEADGPFNGLEGQITGVDDTGVSVYWDVGDERSIRYQWDIPGSYAYCLKSAD